MYGRYAHKDEGYSGTSKFFQWVEIHAFIYTKKCIRCTT